MRSLFRFSNFFFMENLLSFVVHVLDKHMLKFKAINAVESKGIVYD